MEQRVTRHSAHGGFMLVMVLVITGIGLLFGAGALLLFRYQCQMRVDRQHELEKVYAVRSALNFIRTYVDAVPDRGISFRYRTQSERDLGLLVKPVEVVFPGIDDSRHLDIGNIRKKNRYFESGSASLDYEYGWDGEPRPANHQLSNTHKREKGIAFTDTSSTNTKWWVNIGMPDTGGWLQEDYGRRYFFWQKESLGSGDTGVDGDITRLCIIRDIENSEKGYGSRLGWPLSRKDERALVFQVQPIARIIDVGSTNEVGNAVMSLFECEHNGVDTLWTELVRMTNCPSMCYMGLQLADNKASIFYISNKGGGGLVNPYTFSDCVEISPDMYAYFADELKFGGRTYAGITNIDGRVVAPDLRAVLEIEAASQRRDGAFNLPDAEPKVSTNLNFLADFRVTPAYQYDIFLEHPAAVTNLATVAQKIGEYSRYGYDITVLTYDTHGTEHKGFRQDEREASRGGGK